MAAKAKPLPRDIGKVLVPAKLLATLGCFLNSLHNPIINEAAERALSRKSGPTAGRVTPDDILQASQSVLSSSLTGLADLLCGTSHARKKAS